MSLWLMAMAPVARAAMRRNFSATVVHSSRLSRRRCLTQGVCGGARPSAYAVVGIAQSELSAHDEAAAASQRALVPLTTQLMPACVSGVLLMPMSSAVPPSNRWWSPVPGQESSPESVLACREQGRTPTEYELSRGKIIDTLQNDYADFFEKEPSFDIYDEAVCLEIGHPPHGVRAVRGKSRYIGFIRGLRRVLRGAVSDGSIECRIRDGAAYGYAIRVHWTCTGHLAIWGTQHPVHVSALSLYAMQDEAASGAIPDASVPACRIHQHKIEILDIQPPFLRSQWAEAWRGPAHGREPVFAF